MTIADICLFCDLDFVSGLSGDAEFVKQFELLVAHKARVLQNEKVKAWVDKRPDSPL